jgi:hypothetical protein
MLAGICRELVTQKQNCRSREPIDPFCFLMIRGEPDF